jgi:DNA-binding response OmpR family regulator
LGANVTGTAATTAEATKLMSERLPRVALVDFHLRDGDSSGLVAELRNKGVVALVDFHLRDGDSSGLVAKLRNKGVPVIILSGCCMTKVVGNNSEIT